MEKITRKYADLALFIEAARLEGYNPDIKMDDSGNPMIMFEFSRVATNPGGFIIGNEDYRISIYLEQKRYNEMNTQHRHEDLPNVDIIDKDNHLYDTAHWIVDLATLDVRCISAPESESCDCDDNDAYDCMCELYINPLDDDIWMDAIYEETVHRVDEIMKRDVQWMLCVDANMKRHWDIVEYHDGIATILHEGREI